MDNKKNLPLTGASLCHLHYFGLLIDGRPFKAVALKTVCFSVWIFSPPLHY